MRFGVIGLLALSVAGCASSTQWELFEREVGRTIADVTLIGGEPDRVADLPDGRRAFGWERDRLVPRGGPRCLYTLYAQLEGNPRSLAAWRVVEIAPPGPGCEPPPNDPFLEWLGF